LEVEAEPSPKKDFRDSVLIINDDDFVKIEGFNMNDFNKRQ